MMSMRKRILLALATLAVAFLAIQAVPYGRDHSNPPTMAEPQWDSAATRALAVRACFDCHSNQTQWPAYSVIAPGSWLIYHDVVQGREVLNFSEWQRPYEEAGEAPEVVREGEMPPAPYLLLHASARLSPAEQEQLAQGLVRTLGGSDEVALSGDAGAAAR